jgi:hypothetical protein
MQALNYFWPLQQVTEYNTPGLWARLVQCQAAMGVPQPHEDMYRAILDGGVSPSLFDGGTYMFLPPLLIPILV